MLQMIIIGEGNQELSTAYNLKWGKRRMGNPDIEERSNKGFCYTFQLKYILQLEKNMPCVVGQNSLTP